MLERSGLGVLAVLTGYVGRSKSSEPSTRARWTMNGYIRGMIVVTILVVTGVIVRLTSYHDRGYSPALVVVLPVLVAVLVALGASPGGSMVFDYGFNVETSGNNPVCHASETDVVPRRQTLTRR